MAQEKTGDVTLVIGKNAGEGIGLKMTLADAFGIAARVREVEPEVQLIWTTPPPHNGEIMVIF